MPKPYYDKLIIADTSSLIAFKDIDKLDILEALCGNVFITSQVASEYRGVLPEWIKILEVKDTAKLQSFTKSLDLGEASAITLALETENPLLILDDGKARRFALALGINITGTIGLLITAHQNGLLADLNDTIEKLREKNFRMPPDIDEYLSKV
jgi:predicted nucleic acid-binding protein